MNTSTKPRGLTGWKIVLIIVGLVLADVVLMFLWAQKYKSDNTIRTIKICIFERGVSDGKMARKDDFSTIELPEIFNHTLFDVMHCLTPQEVEYTIVGKEKYTHDAAPGEFARVYHFVEAGPLMSPPSPKATATTDPAALYTVKVCVFARHVSAGQLMQKDDFETIEIPAVLSRPLFDKLHCLPFLYVESYIDKEQYTQDAKAGELVREFHFIVPQVAPPSRATNPNATATPTPSWSLYTINDVGVMLLEAEVRAKTGLSNPSASTQPASTAPATGGAKRPCSNN